MKKITTAFLPLVFIVIILTGSCETMLQYPGRIQFSFSAGEAVLKSMESTYSDSVFEKNTWQVILSIEDVKGNSVFIEDNFRLIPFGNSFITEKIEIPAGDYSLTGFLVINPAGEVQYAAPLKESSTAVLVNNPLPLFFSVARESTTLITPQVIPVLDYQPEDFGYMAFGFEIVRPLTAWVSVVDDNPLYMKPSASLPAELKVYTAEGLLMKYDLAAGVNKIFLPNEYNSFEMTLENPHYPSLNVSVNADSLRNSTPSNPYVFNFYQENKRILYIQPGPGESKDAMITNLNPNQNFGNHPYFEASFMTEPVLTVMRTRWSLIEFDLSDLPDSASIEEIFLKLTFETPLWDSLYESHLDDFMIWQDTLVFRKITQPWDEQEVSWANQPQTQTNQQVFVPSDPHLSSSLRSYEVTSLFTSGSAISFPDYGFMFRHQDISRAAPGGMRFASGDYHIPEMRPQLIVCYSIPANKK